MVRNGSCREFQRYLCKDCDRTFNDKTGTIFAHSKVALRRWWFSIYAFLRFNTSLRQLQCEIEVTHKMMHRPIEILQKTSRPVSQSVSNCDRNCTETRDETHSSTLSERRSEINMCYT